jgi:hypothetical protein
VNAIFAHRHALRADLAVAADARAAEDRLSGLEIGAAARDNTRILCSPSLYLRVSSLPPLTCATLLRLAFVISDSGIESQPM